MKAKTPSQLILPTLHALVYAVVIAACSTSDILGQNTATGIRGIVRDQSGAVVPKTAIKLTDNATGIEYTTVSSSDGGFLIPNLQSGAYKLTASATGFQTAIYPSIDVDSGRTTNVSVDLQVGTTSEVVQVTASDARLDT